MRAPASTAGSGARLPASSRLAIAHHADPTCARHGVKPGQIDISARLMCLLEKAGLVDDVRWPTARRLERITVT
jgi:hypothetical protein